MTGINDLWALVIATLIFLAIPGPGTIKIFASMAEINGGPRAGFWSTLGLMAGDAVWMVLALSGVAALAAAYPRAFDLLRYAGAAYLAWIGYTLIRDSKQTMGEGVVSTKQGRGAWQWFRYFIIIANGTKSNNSCHFYHQIFFSFANSAK